MQSLPRTVVPQHNEIPVTVTGPDQAPVVYKVTPGDPMLSIKNAVSRYQRLDLDKFSLRNADGHRVVDDDQIWEPITVSVEYLADKGSKGRSTYLCVIEEGKGIMIVGNVFRQDGTATRQGHDYRECKAIGSGLAIFGNVEGYATLFDR
ncbi:MAG: hypothetical protein M1834_003240 [Cirrosporium novae-zelandiae]|nr:MAG: hypothetical protein M1834_003240 [Cirrosporium novae-zelandiae]